jgi:AraC-like DNA-binding protein
MTLFESRQHFIEGGGTVNGIMFHVVFEGEGVIECDGVKYSVDKNKMLVMWPNSFVKYDYSSNGSWLYRWIWLAGTKAQWVLSKIGINPDNTFFDVSECDNFLNCLDRISQVFLSGEHSIFYPVQAGWEIIDALGKDIATPLSASGSDNIADMCRILIENKPESFSSVNDLAERFNVDRTTIFRLFKAAFNVSPKEYIETMRFERACQLLSRTEMKIKEISNICGYDNQCYFTSAFQKRFSCSPTKWRKSHMSSKEIGQSHF